MNINVTLVIKDRSKKFKISVKVQKCKMAEYVIAVPDASHEHIKTTTKL